MADEVIERVVNREGRLLGLGQAIEVSQDLGTTITQLEIELATGAQLQQVQMQTPPGQEAAIVNAGLLNTCIGEPVEPGIELGEEVTDGLRQGTASDQGRPALSFRKRARARSRARVS